MVINRLPYSLGEGGGLPPVAPSELFVVDDNGNITSVDFSNNPATEITVPSVINGKKIIGITSTFGSSFNWGKITKLVIPFKCYFSENYNESLNISQITDYVFGDNFTKADNLILFGENLKSLSFAEGVIPTLYPNLFYGVKSLELQKIVDSYYAGALSIPGGCFKKSSGLTNLDIFIDIESISGLDAFYESNVQGNVHFSKLTLLTQGSFWGTNIDSITLDSCTEIGDYAFNNCQLISITLKAPIVVKLGNNAFSNTFRFRDIYVPANLVDAYKADANWSQYADKIKAIEE